MVSGSRLRIRSGSKALMPKPWTLNHNTHNIRIGIIVTLELNLHDSLFKEPLQNFEVSGLSALDIGLP